MSPSEQQLWTSVPDRHDDFVPLPERLQRVPTDSGETEISDFDDSSRGDEDVGWFEISMEDVVGVQVEDPVDQLVEQGFERREGERGAEGLGVVMDDLLQKTQREELKIMSVQEGGRG